MPIAFRCFHYILLKLIFIGFLVSLSGKVYSQDTGIKYFKNYNFKEKKYPPQNWCILQGQNGVIYIGNQAGLIQFDGAHWHYDSIPNRSVRSLAITDSGTIYIGGKNEIGFLSPELKGSQQYVSLLKYLNQNKQDISYVWGTHSTTEGIYFRTLNRLIRWNPNLKRMKLWEPDNYILASFTCKGKLFIRLSDVGLMEMVGDSLKSIPQGEFFSEKKIFMMSPYDDRKILIGTRYYGLYLYDGVRPVPFPTEVDDYLRENQLSHGIRLACGHFALATSRGGVVFIDSLGQLRYVFNKDTGLQDDDVKYVFEDNRGILWIGLDNGVSRIEYASPFSVYDQHSGLKGLLLAVTIHGPQQDLYTGSTRGLFLLATSGQDKGRFSPIPGVANTCWSLLSTADSLLAATDEGIFQVEGNNLHRITDIRTYVLVCSKKKPNRIWAGTHFGLVALYRKNETGKWVWKQEHKFETITHPIATIVEDRQGSLWLGTFTEQVLKVDFPLEAVIIHPVVTPYNTSNKLPQQNVKVFTAAKHIIFSSEKGIYRFDEAKQVFVPDLLLGKAFADGSNYIFRLQEDKNRNIWFHYNYKTSQAIPRADGTYVLNPTPFLGLSGTQVNAIYPDPRGDIIWFTGHDRLIRYNTTVKRNYNYDFPALIRKVQLINDKVVVFDAYKANAVPAYNTPLPSIAYRDRNLRIEFAAPFFEDETKTLYRFLLEGYEKNWSPWTTEAKKDYTNLDTGFYNFRVQAKNIYEQLSREGAFQFRVLPPWYQTWWAFLCYALISLLIIYFTARWRSRYLEKEKQRLEQIIKDRTKEVEEKSRLLESQTIQLKEQSHQLKELDKAKSRFFANISHEFRTPLTLIMGPLEQIISKYRDSELETTAAVMLRNSRRLLGLIDQLLELSKLDSGKLTLRASPQNIVPFLKTTIASFESLVLHYKLDLTFHAEAEEITFYFDPEKTEKIIGNLLANAVKFTPAGGKITVSIKTNPTKEANFPIGSVDITVADTGMGIPEDQLPHLFNRFYQVSGSHSYPYELKLKGSGIGLSLVNELVTLHHGEIRVRSSTGEDGKTRGTEFIVRLPKGKAHFKPGEIAEVTEHEPLHDIPVVDLVEIEEKKEDNVQGEKPEAGMDTDAENVILVVEDNADMRNYIRSSLEPSYRVIEAVDGSQGIEKAREIVPDLIISDIMMPELDGYELCRVLKKDVGTSHIPTILLTAKASEESIIQGLETGADDYITKPFNTKILAARIKNLIDLRRQLQLKRKRQMTLQPAEISVSSVDETFLKELQDIIEKNLGDAEFNVEQLCKKLYIGRTTLYRKILALTGEKPTEFIRSYRLKRAAQLLNANFGNVTEVAFEVGFSNTAYFTRCFKEKFHQSPSTYQASKVKDH
jgi:signal transduction histidine kinase/DNA-binding response OmpR family regulator